MREGYRELVAAGPTVADAAQPGRAAAFLRFLRDAAGSGIGVTWQGRIELDAPEWVFSHLAAPGSPARGTLISYGKLFHWRQGPGFVQVTDRRDGGKARIMTFGDAVLLRAFASIQQPLDVSATHLQDADRRALAFLCEQGIGLPIGQVIIGLPCRMTRWPMPAFP